LDSALPYDLFDRRVEGQGIVHADEIDALPPESFGVARYQLPVMLFAAKAENRHLDAVKPKKIPRLWDPGRSAGDRLCLLLLGSDDLPENVVQSLAQFPVGVMSLKLPQIGDVADVISLAIFVHIFPVELFAGHFGDFRN